MEDDEIARLLVDVERAVGFEIWVRQSSLQYISSPESATPTDTVPTASRPWDALTGRLVEVGYINRIDGMSGELQLRYGNGERVSHGRQCLLLLDSRKGAARMWMLLMDRCEVGLPGKVTGETLSAVVSLI